MCSGSAIGAASRILRSCSIAAKLNPRWATFKKIDTEYANAIKAAGGTVDWINLPEIGIKGNSHMMMQDKNSDQIAEVIQKWLVGKGLVE